MIVLEMKAVVKPSQCSAIDEAIRTVQFIRNNLDSISEEEKRKLNIKRRQLSLLSYDLLPSL